MNIKVNNSLLCPLISSWITLPSSSLFMASLYFILKIPDKLFFILVILFTISFPTIAIFITISFNTNNIKFYKISYYISFAFLVASFLFFFGFFIGGFIYIAMNLQKIDLFIIFYKCIGIFFPFGILTSMLLNITSYYKNLTENEKENKVQIQSSSSFY